MVIDDAIVLRPLAQLRPHPENAKIFGDPTEAKQYDEVRDSIKRHGLFEPIVVTTDGKILSGHLRVCALMELGHGEAPCRVASFGTYREEVEFVIRSNTDRRHLTPEQIAFAFERLRRLPKEDGGLKRKAGRPKGADRNCGVSPTISDRAREEASESVGIGTDEARALSSVFVEPKSSPEDTSVEPACDVPPELKSAVKNGKIAPTPAAKMVQAERKRQGGKIQDPAPIKAWVETKTAPKLVEPTDHEERVAEEARKLSESLSAMLDVYTKFAAILRKCPLKSVIGPTEHHRYSGLIRDIAILASDQLESVQATESLGRQLKLTAIQGGKA